MLIQGSACSGSRRAGRQIKAHKHKTSGISDQ
jgi:hypothetical protein